VYSRHIYKERERGTIDIGIEKEGLLLGLELVLGLGLVLRLGLVLGLVC
jgi:hypothetical protein